MTIDKKGTPNKISVIIVGEEQFNKTYDSIAQENNLVKCPKCGKLLSKLSNDGSKTIQHRGLKAISFSDKLTIVCSQCGTIVEF